MGRLLRLLRVLRVLKLFLAARRKKAGGAEEAPANQGEKDYPPSELGKVRPVRAGGEGGGAGRLAEVCAPS